VLQKFGSKYALGNAGFYYLDAYIDVTVLISLAMYPFSVVIVAFFGRDEE
jgi:hypothetical protein